MKPAVVEKPAVRMAVAETFAGAAVAMTGEAAPAAVMFLLALGADACGDCCSAAVKPALAAAAAAAAAVAAVVCCCCCDVCCGCCDACGCGCCCCCACCDVCCGVCCDAGCDVCCGCDCDGRCGDVCRCWGYMTTPIRSNATLQTKSRINHLLLEWWA